MELQHISLESIPSQKLQKGGMTFRQILAGIANHEPSDKSNDENVGMDGVVSEFIPHVSKAKVPETDKSQTHKSLRPGDTGVMSPSIGPGQVLARLLHESPADDSNPRTIFISLETEMDFFGEEKEGIDSGRFVKGTVDRLRDEDGQGATLPIRHSKGLFQFDGEVAGDECHEESLRVEGNDVIKVQTNSGSPAEHNRKVIDSNAHADNTLNTEILLFIKIEKVSKSRHPDVGADKDADEIVSRPGSVVVIHDERELHPSLPFFRLST